MLVNSAINWWNDGILGCKDGILGCKDLILGCDEIKAAIGINSNRNIIDNPKTIHINF